MTTLHYILRPWHHNMRTMYYIMRPWFYIMRTMHYISWVPWLPYHENSVLYIMTPSYHIMRTAYYPSKHAGSDSHPVRIRWEALARSGPDVRCSPACFRTGSVWPKTWHSQPELNRIRAGFAQYYPGRLWVNETESKSGKLVAGRSVAFCPDQAIQIGSGSVLHNMIHASLEKTELKRMREVWSCIYYPARFWLHAGRNGHNWP